MFINEVMRNIHLSHALSIEHILPIPLASDEEDTMQMYNQSFIHDQQLMKTIELDMMFYWLRPDFSFQSMYGSRF